MRLTSELRQMYVCRKKSILDCVFCVLHISEMPKGPPVEHREVARDNRVEFFWIRAAPRSVVGLSICLCHCFYFRHSASLSLRSYNQGTPAANQQLASGFTNAFR